MQIPLKVNKIYFFWHQEWPHNDLLLLKSKTLKLRFSQGILDIYFVGLKNVKDSQFWCYIFQKNIVLFNNSPHAWFVHTASQANFHCNLFWFLTILPFVDLRKLGVLTGRGRAVFFMVSTEHFFLKLFDLIGNCAFGDLSNGRVINGVNNPWVRITSLPWFNDGLKKLITMINHPFLEAVFEILKSHFNKNYTQNICYLQFVSKIGVP